MAYDNELKGALFKNEDKQSDKHPDYKGSCVIDGVDFWVDAWINEAQTGRRYMSLRFNPKQAQQKQQQRQAPAPAPRQQAAAPAPKPRDGTGFADMDDDIPFLPVAHHPRAWGAV